MPCVQVLFIVVSQVPVSVHCESLVQKPACDTVPKLAFVPRLSLGCAVQADESSGGFPQAIDPERPVCVGCRILSYCFELLLE